MSANSIQPNNTLYVTAINEKVKKLELRRQLYNLFSQYGKVVDVVATRREGQRGQAFIVFAQLTGASSALRALQGFPFYDNPLKIAYARTKSNAIKMMEGVYVEARKPKSKKADDDDETAAESSAPKKRVREDEDVNGKPHANGKRLKGDSSQPEEEEDDRMDVDEQPKEKTNETAEAPPYRILYVQNLPPGVTDQMLSMLFTQYPGFKEVRMVPGKPGIAFIEYENEEQAVVARRELNNFKLSPQREMAVNFAQRMGASK
ncbi:hypothetical protein SmJEL517_g00941 [Synchytrium microbalum]|uniref:RRM domain-containing protein n=1 Tax=Synchytrium microbalum TaxID=1806994 RepID=A0A507CHP3_9FUNG|nr:uncharacterized protein SmJEL517_g00941 [Synchytrium microbalum]TPX37123.1 hypothetical protein SmJEL517_g00941 [Synchytrium microbalum]